MEYITIKDKENANLKTIADKLDELRVGGTHEVLVQVQGNTEDICQLQSDLFQGLHIEAQVENLDQDLLMLTFRREFHNSLWVKETF